MNAEAKWLQIVIAIHIAINSSVLWHSTAFVLIGDETESPHPKGVKPLLFGAQHF